MKRFIFIRIILTNLKRYVFFLEIILTDFCPNSVRFFLSFTVGRNMFFFGNNSNYSVRAPSIVWELFFPKKILASRNFLLSFTFVKRFVLTWENFLHSWGSKQMRNTVWKRKYNLGTTNTTPNFQSTFELNFDTKSVPNSLQNFILSES